MATIESLITEAGRRGLLVNNLFQISRNRWQANIRTPAPHEDDKDQSIFHEFGRGGTAVEALQKALSRAERTQSPSRTTIIKRPIVEDEFDPLADDFDPLAD